MSQGNLAERTQILPIVELAQAQAKPQIKDSLTLVSINLAHGRQDSINQMLVSKRVNLNLKSQQLHKSLSDKFLLTHILLE